MPSKSNEGAKEDTDGETAKVCKAPLVTEPARKQLNQRQVVDYKEERRSLLTWLRDIGKNPSRGKGYASDTVYNRAYRIDAFYRWVWEFEGAYTTTLTTDHADAYCRELLAGDYSDNHRANTQKALKSLFKWRQYQRGGDKWEPTITLTGAPPSRQPKDFFEKDERTALREAALEYGTVPHYNSLSADERQIWKRHLAQRFGIPVEGVNADTFERANGWKIPSLVQATLDGGLRPKEVGRARVSWVDTDNNVLRIPPEDATKSNDSWTVAIRPQTSQALQRWIGERECYDKYSGTDRLWLTRESNPYGSTSLNRLLENLCEQAEIDTTHRDLSWYSIRHSVGTLLTNERDLEAARVQLRHQSRTTTMKYDSVSTDDRRDALDRIG
ncbi:tyrosine-type recombinase/integrase [Haloferax volcanii]|uniref:Phage integrase family domain-containing protein n=3 Tax=Haloferax volcanii TaxID=2246 RepID=A0A384KB48_HALVD|nr:site-specific integrase [Haloferax volcanii]ADE03311.1 XerC/D-like integrase [Haloferax volcanii DS2]ELY32403.1 Phage integrase family domain-containing protein [Haloferax volcanii DS2]MBS8118567.1 site-specific integrase [Haloferax volcanii]MBS8123580.1 site-specific integrase [Haloferax volcanii]MBS8127448.1 site-specific integrase [Haloferax volcanii]